MLKIISAVIAFAILLYFEIIAALIAITAIVILGAAGVFTDGLML
jgi:hypothetical protein